MGFYEDDRIRRKNRVYNLSTPDINYAARLLLKKLSIEFRGETLINRLNNMMATNDDQYTREVLCTSIKIINNKY